MTATVGRHTHIYMFPPEETEQATQLIKQHCVEGRLHPYAALMLVTLGRAVDESGD